MEALAEEQRCEQHDPRWPGSRCGHAHQRAQKTAAYVDALPSTTNIVPLRVERNASRRERVQNTSKTTKGASRRDG